MKLTHLFENEISDITDPKEAYQYAFNKKRRIPELEPIILKGGPILLLNYIQNILGDRWLEAEPILKQSPPAWVLYLHKFRSAEFKPLTKDTPLSFFGRCVFKDVPNNITDEQVVQMFNIIGIKTNVKDVKEHRVYNETIVDAYLNVNTITKFEIKHLSKKEKERIQNFLSPVYHNDDFED